MENYELLGRKNEREREGQGERKEKRKIKNEADGKKYCVLHGIAGNCATNV